MTVSQSINSTPENLDFHKKMLSDLSIKCREKFFGDEYCHNYKLGVNEHARNFSQKKVPFGSYKINNDEVLLINKHELTEETRQAFAGIVMIKTEVSNIYVLPVGKALTLNSVREPLLRVYKRKKID